MDSIKGNIVLATEDRIVIWEDWCYANNLNVHGQSIDKINEIGGFPELMARE